MRLRPQIEDSLFSSKAFVGEVLPFSCVSFREGHDKIGVDLVLTSPVGETTRTRLERGNPGLDEWQTVAQLTAEGEWRWHMESFGDDYATWRHNAEIKVPAGIDVEVMLEEGARVLDRAEQTPAVVAAAAAARDDTATDVDRLRALLADAVVEQLTASPVRSLVTESDERVIRVERQRAGFGAWYEFFPRSEGAVPNADGSWQSGTFQTASKRLEGVAAMGFDVVYLPPIHPIGSTNRKGPNNTLVAGPNDPGSPWAIGAAAGGHKDVHPDLGTEADFVAFREKAETLGMEIALDLALQATPDHPWVKTHPEWFTTLADGTIAYAENPPKKYQDIYPINFDNDQNGFYAEVLDVVRHWIGLGVKIFRVDNPHTKPLQFWEWLIHDINADYPDVLFLAEAFTRPAVMQSLAKAGFQQSYSYFTWRNTRAELEEFLTSVSKDTSDFMRPNLFVNTPDILTEYLQHGGRPAYEARAVIASMAGPSWGMYAGFELVENVARPGAEEQIDNEKYQYKNRDYSAGDALGIADLLSNLNRIRSEHLALRRLRNVTINPTNNDNILCFTKVTKPEESPDGSVDMVIVVLNHNPFVAQSATIDLDLSAFGTSARWDGAPAIEVHDELSGATFHWNEHPYVSLDPQGRVAHILSVKVL